MQTPSMQPGSERERVEELQAQVHVLQQQLHQLHAGDVNTLRRSHATVAQHVEALKLEATRLEELVKELEPELYPPEYIAEELGKAAVVSGSVFVIFKVVKTITPMPGKLSSWMSSGLAAVTAIVVSWRFARSSISRFAASLLDHKRRRKAVLREMAELRQRVDILHALTSSLPHALHHQQQPSGHQAGSSAATAAATAAGGGGESRATGEEAGSAQQQQQQQQQQQRGEQFVVVDLPRVESGGFALQSPTVASPAPELAAAQQAAAAFAAASAAAAGAAAAAAVDSRAVAAAVQQQMVGTAAAAARSATAAVGAGFQQALASSSSTAASVPQSQQQRQQLRRLSEEPGPSASSSSSTRSSLEQRQPSRSAFAVPLPSTIMSGWGGVVMQQEQRAHTQAAGQAAGGSSGPAVSAPAAADRQVSTGSEGQGEWLEQPSYYDSTEASAGGRGGNGAERASPQSSSSDEGVLLERE